MKNDEKKTKESTASVPPFVELLLSMPSDGDTEENVPRQGTALREVDFDVSVGVHTINQQK